MIARYLQSYRRRGAVAVLVAISMVTLLLFGALAVDVGYICAIVTEQQNTADASALAGAGVLQYGDTTTTNQHVLDVIALNQQPQGYLSLDDQIIEIGIWNSVTNEFTPYDESNWDGAFAVRVRAARNQTPLFFAAIAGITETDIWREAVAVGSSPCGGIWGLEGILKVAGSIRTDSFNSTEGSYNLGSAYDNGDLCSGRGIRLVGGPEINGDVMAGFGYEVETSGQPLITGMTSNTLEGVVAPTVDFSDVAVNNDNGSIGLTDLGYSPFTSGSNLRMQANDSLTLPGGTYYLESLEVHSSASLNFTGPTTIYLSGPLKASGAGLVNTSENPADLTIISSATEIDVTGTYGFYGTILAPNADVKLGGTAEMWGALVGRTVTISGNFEFHVDESLPYAQPWYDVPPPMLVR